MSRPSNPLDRPPRAFISYARADGEILASSLRERLERELPELTLWYDRSRMEGGIGWWKQITEALDQVEFLVMVMTPAALESEVARREWRYARHQGVRICPVMAADAPSLDFRLLPSWMRKAHVYDLDKEWANLIGFLLSARKDNRIPFMAPDLRLDFVQRPAEFEALLGALLDPARTEPIAVTTALQGAGGFGKTTLAIAVCHHEDVVDAFDDGVLWATLGQTPKLQGELTKLYAALTGERPAFIDVDDASIQLAARLDEKNCLIVLDDVWDPSHARPFLRGGRQCARLITTRMRQVAAEFAANRVLVNEMTEVQSVQMLGARLDQTPIDTAPMAELARRLGEWPLLLRLAASQLSDRVERGASFEAAIGYVNRALERRGITGLDCSNAISRGDAVASTVSASLNLFGAVERLRCAELAVLPRGVSTPLSTIAALWSMDEFDAEELVQRLDDAALLDFDLKSATLRMHDVLQAYLYDLLDDPASVHARLVRQGWHDLHALPDGYAWRWVGWHLVRANHSIQLEALLLDFDWLAAKLAATDIQALLTDFDLLPESGELRSVRDALRLASHGLARDAGQLAGQLIGRLEPTGSTAIDRLLTQAAERARRPWLKLTHRSLSHPGGALIGILKGHAGAVEALALSADGSQIVSCSSDRTARVWDRATGRVARVLEGHAASVFGVAVSADGRHAVTGSEDLTLRVWDLESGQTVRVLRGHYGGVYGVAMNPRGDRAASVSDDGTARVWNLVTGEHKRIYKSSAHQLRAVAFSPCGERLIFSTGEWSTLLVDIASAETLQTFEGHAGHARALAFSADGKSLLSGGDDGSVRLWDVASGRTRLILEGHTGSVEAVAISPTCERAVSGSADRSLRVWDLQSGATLAVLEGHSGFVRAVALLPGATQAMSASSDRTLRQWDLDGSVSALAASPDPGPITMLAISDDGSRAASATRAGVLRLWDAARGSAINAVPVQGGAINALWVTANESGALIQSRDRAVPVWDLDAGAVAGELRGHQDRIRRVVLSQDRTRAVVLTRDRTLRVWDLASGKAQRVLVGQDNERVLANLRSRSALLFEMALEPDMDVAPVAIGREAQIALSPDGARVLLADQNQLLVWDIDSGLVACEQSDDLDTVALAFDPGGRFALIGSRFGALRMFDMHAARTIQLLEGHTKGMLDIVVVPDGSAAVTAARDDTIRVWDLVRGRQHDVLAGPWGQVDEVAISADGQFAFSVYGDTLMASQLREMRAFGSLSLDHLITALAVAPDGRRLAVGEDSGRVHFFDVLV